MQRRSLNSNKSANKNYKSKRKIRNILNGGTADTAAPIESGVYELFVKINNESIGKDYLTLFQQINRPHTTDDMLSKIVKSILEVKLDFEIKCIEKCASSSCKTIPIYELSLHDVRNILMKRAGALYNDEQFDIIIRNMNINQYNDTIDMIQIVVIIKELVAAAAAKEEVEEEEGEEVEGDVFFDAND